MSAPAPKNRNFGNRAERRNFQTVTECAADGLKGGIMAGKRVMTISGGQRPG